MPPFSLVPVFSLLSLQAAHVERRLPFAWVFGREHWAVSLYGANVFVDQVMVALELPSVAGPSVSCVSTVCLVCVLRVSSVCCVCVFSRWS